MVVIPLHRCCIHEGKGASWLSSDNLPFTSQNVEWLLVSAWSGVGLPVTGLVFSVVWWCGSAQGFRVATVGHVCTITGTVSWCGVVWVECVRCAFAPALAPRCLCTCCVRLAGHGVWDSSSGLSNLVCCDTMAWHWYLYAPRVRGIVVICPI